MFVHSYDPLSSEYFRVTEISQIHRSIVRSLLFFVHVAYCILLLSIVLETL